MYFQDLPGAISWESKPPAVDVPISDPFEYTIDRISRDAGKAIFARTGIGDPYRTGVPYPVFLALLDAFPHTFGATPQELAHKFGFVHRYVLELVGWRLDAE